MFLSCSTAFGRGPAHFLDRLLEALGAARGVPGDVDRGGAERAVELRFDRADLGEVLVGQDRLRHFEPLVRARLAAEQVRARADHREQAHHQLLADRVDRRVGDLGEVLLEIVVEQPRAVGQHRDRRVGAHRPDRIVAIDGHRLEELGDVFLGVAERLLALEQRTRFRDRIAEIVIDLVQILELVLCLVEPLFVRMRVRKIGLESNT